MKKSKPLIRNRQKKIEQKNTNRAAKQQFIDVKQQKGKNIVFSIFQTIVHFFPDLFDKMREIKDYRPRSNYQLADELIRFHSKFSDCVKRSESRDHFYQYMVGQFSHLERKSIEPIAQHVKDGKIRAIQRFK